MSILAKGRIGHAILLLWLAGISPLTADDGLKKPLDHDSYDQWNQISGTSLSRDGRWIIYSLVPGKGEPTLKIRELTSQREYTVERGTSARFTHDNCHVICIVQPYNSLKHFFAREARMPL